VALKNFTKDKRYECGVRHVCKDCDKKARENNFRKQSASQAVRKIVQVIESDVINTRITEEQLQALEVLCNKFDTNEAFKVLMKINNV
jgi:hypothetical protein